MCQALEELHEDGVILGALEVYQEFGMTKEEAICKVMEKYNLTKERVESCIEEYQK